MRLRFLAKEDRLVPVPGVTPYAGQLMPYVGRRFDAENRAYPATDEPFECDSESPVGRRLAFEITRRDGDLWPADEATAQFCGVSFARTQFKDGVHLAAVVAAKKSESDK